MQILKYIAFEISSVFIFFNLYSWSKWFPRNSYNIDKYYYQLEHQSTSSAGEILTFKFFEFCQHQDLDDPPQNLRIILNCLVY